MGKYTERITNHRINALTTALIEATQKARELHFEDESNQEGLVRLSTGAEYIHSVVTGVNPYLTKPADLEVLSTHIDTIISNLNLFVSERNGQYANTANDALDNCLDITSKLLPKQPKAVYKGLPKIFEDANTRIISHRKFILDQQKLINETKTKIETEINDFKNNLELKMNTLRESHNVEIEGLTENINDTRESLEKELNELATNLTTTITKTTDDFNESIQTQVEKLDTYIIERRKVIDSLQKDAIAKFQDLEQKVVAIVGATGNAAMAGEFKIIATDEGVKADQFQKWTNWAWLALAVIAVGVLVEQLVHNWFGRPAFPNGWGAVGSRLFVSLSVAALGGYLMRQADRHRTVSRWAKRLAAEISSMGAFLAPLDDEQQRAIRAAIALRIFGQPSEMEPVDKKSELVGPALPSVDGLSKVLGQVLEAAKLAKDK